MDKEKDEMPPRPSTSIPPTQESCGPGKSYYPPFIYTYAWGSQPPSGMPPFGPTMLYPPSSNAEESRQLQNIMLPPSGMPHFGPMMLYPPSSNVEESRQLQNIMLRPSIPPFGPTMIYPPSSNADESGRVQNIILPPSGMPPFGPTILYPPSSNVEELGQDQNIMLLPSMPPFGPTMRYPPSSNVEGSGQVQNIIQPPSMSYPPSSSSKELRRSGMTPQLASESSTMPFTSESEKILGSASHMTDQSCQKSK
ncbi:proline-rich receptor-like protein kinase PERK14 isoform X2 [Juglans regia]|nr:proline-rich receptor-like protein kinase PERK14 isoform X2 [Juglans regia]